MERDDLIRALSDSDANELAVLVAQREEAKRRALEDPTKSNLDAREKAAQMVEVFLSKATKGTGLVLRTQIAASSYLQGKGFAVKNSKFNKDFKAGLVATNQDGHFEEGPLLAYAAAYLKPKAKLESQKTAEAQEGKLSADQDLKRVMAERHQVKLAKEKGEVMPRSDFELEMAARAQFFASELRQIPAMVVAHLVALVKGDESLIPKARAYLDEELAATMDAWSKERTFVVELPEARADD